MAINRQDSRHRIKRSTLTGVVPTVPVSSDFTDGTWLNTDIRAGEFFYNIPDEKLWIGTNTVPLELTSSIGNTLADVLANGNNSGTNNIIMGTTTLISSANGGAAISLDTSGLANNIFIATDGIGMEASIEMTPSTFSINNSTGDLTLWASTYPIGMLSNVQMSSGKVIKSSNGGGQIDLDYFSSSGEISITTDGGAQSEYYLYLTPTSGELSGIGGTFNLSSTGVQINAGNTLKIQSRTGAAGYFVHGRYNSSGSDDTIAFKDNFGSSLTTNNSTKPAILIGSQNSTVSAAISNGIILGGSGHTLGAINSIILGGTGNNLSSTSSIMSGTSNTDSSNSGNIVSGLSNTMSTSYSLLVGCANIMNNPGIMYSNVNINGTNDLGSNGFSSAGERTTNATPKDLSTYGQFSANAFQIPTNTAFRVHLTILATDIATGDCKEWEGFGIIKNIAGTTSLVGGTLTLTSTIADASLATATVAATADDGTDSLKITVTGIAATTINWICGIKYDKIIIA